MVAVILWLVGSSTLRHMMIDTSYKPLKGQTFNLATKFIMIWVTCFPRIHYTMLSKPSCPNRYHLKACDNIGWSLLWWPFLVSAVILSWCHKVIRILLSDNMTIVIFPQTHHADPNIVLWQYDNCEISSDSPVGCKAASWWDSASLWVGLSLKSIHLYFNHLKNNCDASF